MRGKGEGSIFKRADGRWVAQLNLGYANGKRQRRLFYGPTRKAVAAQLDEARGKIRDGATLPPASLTIGDLVEQWLADPSDRRNANTNDRYRTAARLTVLPHLAHVRLRDFTPAHVERLQNVLKDQGLAPRTIIKARSVLSGSFRRAQRLRLITYNPLDAVDAPQPDPVETRVLTQTEARRFVEAVRGHRLEALYLVVLALGVRKGEALGLSWRDLDWDAGTLRVRQQVQRIEHGGGRHLVQPKTRASRRVLYLPAIALTKLREHERRLDQVRQGAGAKWQEHGLMFPSVYGTPMEPRNLSRTFEALRERIGVPELTLHGLRHSATSLYLALGVPPHVVQAIMGHADPKVTLAVYAHAQADDRRRAAQLMDAALQPLAVNWLSTEAGDA